MQSKKGFLIVAILFVSCCSVSARYNYFFYWYAQQHFDLLSFNPAYAGSTDRQQVTFRNLQGWFIKVDNSDFTHNSINYNELSWNGYFKKLHGGIGVSTTVDYPMSQNKYYDINTGVSYAYRATIKSRHILQLGGAVYYRIAGLKADLIYDIGGPLVKERNRDNYIDFSLGVWYRFKGLNTGLSVTNLGSIYLGSNDRQIIDPYAPIVNLSATYDWQVNKFFSLRPYLLISGVKSSSNMPNRGHPILFTVGALAGLGKVVRVGLGYTSDFRLSPNLAFNIKDKALIGVAYNKGMPTEGAFQIHRNYHNFEVSATVKFGKTQSE